MIKHICVKSTSVFLLIVIGVLCLCCVSCSTAPPPEPAFEFHVLVPTLELKSGETVTYTAQLKNVSDGSYTVHHSPSFIELRDVPFGDKSDYYVFSTAIRKNSIKGKQSNIALRNNSAVPASTH